MSVRRLENDDEEKFWEAWIKDELIFCYRYGKLGSSGHTKLKKFKTRAEAEAELEAKLQEKLDEGFSEPGAEEEAEDEEDEAEEAESEDDADESEEDEESEDEKSEDEASDDEEATPAAAGEVAAAAGEAPAAAGEEAEDEDEEDEDEEDEEDEDEDEDDEPRRPPPKAAKAAKVALVPAAPPPPPPPARPRLPDRFDRRDPSPEATESAVKALEALSKAAGKRSWQVSRLGRTARRALERLGGIDPEKGSLSAPFDAVMARVLAPKKPLPLEIALDLLWELDAAAYKRIVGKWRAKMLASPASTAIAVLDATFAAVDDPEVAVHAGATLVDRRLPGDAWKRRFAKVRPFFEEALAEKNTSVAAFLKKLKPDADPVVRARVAAAADVKA